MAAVGCGGDSAMEQSTSKPGRRRFQFSLRTLLLMTTLFAVFLSGYTSDWWRGLSSTDYRILDAALTQYLSDKPPHYTVLVRKTLSKENEWYPSLFDFDEAPRFIPELQHDTLRDFLKNNERSYIVRRRPAADLPYELEPSNEADISRMIKSRGEPDYGIYISRPGIDREGKQALVLVNKVAAGMHFLHRPSGELVILSNENGSWHVAKTVDIDALRESDEFRKGNHVH
jgi:hypothetical protein